MVRKERDRIEVDGSRFADLELHEIADGRHHSLWSFLTRIVPWHPWIAGIAAIVGIVCFGGENSPWVLVVAIIGVAIITVTSIWRHKLNEYKKSDEPGDV